MSWLIAGGLALLLAGITREWLVLRGRHRQRGLLRRWPIPKIPVEQIGPRFRPDELGPTRAAEVTFVGRGTIRVPGGTSDTEAWILAVLAKDAPRVFEFGTGSGKTAYLCAANQPENGVVITLTLAPDQVDAYQPAPGDDRTAERYAKSESSQARFLYEGAPAGRRVVQLFGDSKLFDEGPHAGSSDLVFVDGSHAYSYVVSDTAKALRIVRPGGLVLWHDYSPECPGVFRALNQLARHRALMHIQGTTLVAHRT